MRRNHPPTASPLRAGLWLAVALLTGCVPASGTGQAANAPTLPPRAEDSTRSLAQLENTYWKLLSLRGQAVAVSAQQREPHFVLHSEAGRVAGFGGCNRLGGSYRLQGQALTFGPLVSTEMACAQGMQQEQQFLQALGRVARWRIAGEQLELLDAQGAAVARFESRYLR